jgi:hypothetical protein
MRAAAAWWCARLSPAGGSADQRGRGGGDRLAGQRQAYRLTDRWAEEVLLRDSAAAGAEDPQDHRGAAAALPARPVKWDFVPALGQFLGSAVGLSAAVITRLIETWKAGQRVFAERDLSGVDYVYPVGGRDPCEHPAGGAQAVPAGDDRGPHRRPQGTHRPR